MPQVYDCFTFYNELDLLEVRLRHLYEFVDHFVIVEGSLTHSGKPKNFVFEDNRARFQWAQDKIVHVKADLPKSGTRWARENIQRQFILHGLVDASREDFVLVGDCDEIPSSGAIAGLRNIIPEVFGLEQKACGWYANWYDPRHSWVGTVMCRVGNLWETKSPQYLRDNRFNFRRIRDGGCHFTFLGDVPGAIAKIEAFAHAEYDILENKDPVVMAWRRELGLAPFGKPDDFNGRLLDVNDPSFPPYLREHRNDYPTLFKPSPVELAGAIQGWMPAPELAWLAKTAEDRKIIVEVGSWKGRSTKALAASTPGVVYAIDHWEGSKDEIDSTHAEAVRLTPDGLYAIFAANLATEIAAGRVVPIRADSVAGAARLRELLGDRKADMVFIDCDHSYEAVKRDIELYRTFLAPGGILCGHDYEPGGPGVIQAVNELVPGFSMGGGTIWFR